MIKTHYQAAGTALFGILIIFLMIRCSSGDLSDSSLNKPELSMSKFFVDERAAVKLLSGVHSIEQNARTTESRERRIEEVKSFKNEKGKTVFYIINYEDREGFVILSADKRLKPILAFSEDGSFGEKTDNPGIQLWFDIIKENFNGAQRQSEAHIDVINHWAQLEQNLRGGRILDEAINTPELSCEWFVTHPLPGNSTVAHLTTNLSTWKQGIGYNAYCPAGVAVKNCKGDYQCSKAPTGCGPVAVAQVLKFHHKPVTANGHAYSSAMFNAMPKNAPPQCQPSNANHINLAQLIRDAGKDMDAVYNTIVPALGIPMSGSGCQTWSIPGHIDNFFANRGFTSFDKDFFGNAATVSEELRANRPVIVFGSNCAACAANQHIWVMDGIKDLYAVFNDANGYCYENHSIYYQMNWGWGDISENNTWFSYTGIVGAGTLYNSSNMRAYIIKP